jgi:hypothetical protein
MAGYIYNPAESIRQDFQQTGSALGNIFTQIIQQQQRDYTLAESAFANIEALKKDVNIYGQKSISSKANNLLGHASAAILENGKLDYGKLGEIRQAVSDIKDLKMGYDLAAKEFEKNLQLGASTKDDLTSFEGYYRDINGLMNDENLIKNPRDLQVAFAKVYTNNLDDNKKFIKTFGSIAPYTPVKKEVDNAKGGKTLVQVEAPQGWEVGENGANMPTMYSIANPNGTVSQIPYLTYITEKIKAQDPTLIPLMREKAGVGASNLTDEQFIDFNIKNKIKIPTTIVESKTAAQISREKSLADEEAFKASKMQEQYDLERQLTLSGIAENNAQRRKALSEIGGGGGIPPLDGNNLSTYGINVNSQGKSVDFGAEVEVRTADPSNPNKIVPFKATGLRTLANGTQQLVGYVSTGKIDEKTKEMIYGTQAAYYPYSKTAQTSLSMAIKNLGKDKETNISQSVYYYNTIPVVKKQTAATPPAATSPKPAAAPATANVVYKSVINGIMSNLKGKYKLKNGKTIQTNEDAYQYYRENGNTVK